MESDRTKMCQPKLWYPRIIVFDPLKAGSIDGTDTEPHDRAVIRALNASYKPNRNVVGIPENTVFVARLNPRTSEKTLIHEFSKFGKIIRCRLVKDIVTGFSLRYGFIEYENERDAERAIRRGDKMTLDDRIIFVDHECERLLPGWIPRRLGGGFGGRKESGQLRFGGKEKIFVKPIYLMNEHEMRNQLGKKNWHSDVYKNR